MTKTVRIGNLTIGGGNPVAVQTMTTAKVTDVPATLREIESSVACGADIVRVAVKGKDEIPAFKEVVENSPCPIVADIHFDVNVAIAAVEAGAAKIRINPGNIGGERELKSLASCLIGRGIPVRVGSNTGSIEREFSQKYGRGAEALALSALKYADCLADLGVENIVLSAKAPDVGTTVSAYKILHEKCDYPLHVGVTEAGFGEDGVVKGAMGIGSLLLTGIGDTLRVSLSSPPEEEARVGRSILRAAGLDKNYAEVISCPTCGRCEYDVFTLARKVKEVAQNAKKPMKIAVMGCVVNGPGEAMDADLCIAGGKEKCVIYTGGKPYKRVETGDAEKVFLSLVAEQLRRTDNGRKE